MFEIGKVYWFALSTNTGKTVNVKGEVVEETPYLLKIKRDNGELSVVACARILNVNIAKEEENKNV